MTSVTYRAIVRPTITLLCVLTLIVCVFRKTEVPEPFKSISTAVIMFWFAERQQDKRRGDT